MLLVERDGQKDFVKVLDFGIAKNLTDGDDTSAVGPRRKLTNPGVAMGTPEYMAPEQAAGRPADARSDVYALGGILYEMLVGHPAYEGANFMEVLHKKANFAPQPINKFRDDVPAEIEALIMASMAKDPAARPQSMFEFEQRLQEIARRCFTDGALLASPFGPGPSAGNAPARGPERGHRRGPGGDLLRPAASGRGRGGRMHRAGRRCGRDRTHARARRYGRRRRGWLARGRPRARCGPACRGRACGRGRGSLSDGGAGGRARGAGRSARDRHRDRHARSQRRAGREGAPGRSGDAVGGRAAEAVDEAETMLRTQHFAEARKAFTRLSKNRLTRGRALVALAEIAFQEKNYQETIRSAKLATERGGGARAHVLLGDAHFRMNEFPPP